MCRVPHVTRSPEKYDYLRTDNLAPPEGERSPGACPEHRPWRRAGWTDSRISVRCIRASLQARRGARHWGPVMDVRIRTIEPIQVARIRYRGPLSEVGPCFDRLFHWAAGVGATTGRVLTLSHDNSATTKEDRPCTDACVELRTNETPSPGIELVTVEGGRFAVHRLKGPYEGIPLAYRRLFEEWLPGSGESVDVRPRMELYRNSPLETAPDYLVTDLCVPLRVREPGVL